MEHYYEVIFGYKSLDRVLVKANDVIEAGTRAIEALTKQDYCLIEDDILEITRTKIAKVIE